MSLTRKQKELSNKLTHQIDGKIIQIEWFTQGYPIDKWPGGWTQNVIGRGKIRNYHGVAEILGNRIEHVNNIK